MNIHQELISNEDFFAAVLMGIRVSVSDAESGELIDYGGPIEKYTDFSVRIGGIHYQRHMHTFKVA